MSHALLNLDMVSETVQKGPCQTFGTKDLGPFIKRQIAGHQGGALFVALAKHFKQKFGPGFGQRHEAQLVDDQQPVFCQLPLEAQQAFLILASINSWTKAAAVIKPTERPFWQAARPRPRAIWVLPVPELPRAMMFGRPVRFSCIFIAPAS